MKARKNQVVEETQQSFYEQLYNNYSGLTDGEIFIDQYDGKSNLGIKATSAITIYDDVYTEEDLYNKGHYDVLPSGCTQIYGFLISANSGYMEDNIFLLFEELQASGEVQSDMYVEFDMDYNCCPCESGTSILDQTTSIGLNNQKLVFMGSALQMYAGTLTNKSTSFVHTEYNNHKVFFNTGAVAVGKSTSAGYKVESMPYTFTINSANANNTTDYGIKLETKNALVLRGINLYRDGTLYNEIIPVMWNRQRKLCSKLTKKLYNVGIAVYQYTYDSVVEGRFVDGADSQYIIDRDSINYLYRPSIFQYKTSGSTSWSDSYLWKVGSERYTNTYTDTVDQYYINKNTSNPEYSQLIGVYGYKKCGYTVNGNTYNTRAIGYQTNSNFSRPITTGPDPDEGYFYVDNAYRKKVKQYYTKWDGETLVDTGCYTYGDVLTTQLGHFTYRYQWVSGNTYEMYDIQKLRYQYSTGGDYKFIDGYTESATTGTYKEINVGDYLYDDGTIGDGNGTIDTTKNVVGIIVSLGVESNFTDNKVRAAYIAYMDDNGQSSTANTEYHYSSSGHPSLITGYKGWTLSTTSTNVPLHYIYSSFKPYSLDYYLPEIYELTCATKSFMTDKVNAINTAYGDSRAAYYPTRHHWSCSNASFNPTVRSSNIRWATESTTNSSRYDKGWCIFKPFIKISTGM